MFNYEKLTDRFMLIPILGKIILSIILPWFFDSDLAVLFVTMFIQLILNMIPNIIRTEEMCQCLNFESVAKTFIDGTIAYGAGVVVPFILGWLPFIGLPVTIIGMIPVIGEAALWALFYTLAYIFINMGNQDNKEKWCKPPGFMGRNFADTFFFWLFLVASVVVNVFNEYSPI